MKIYLVAVEALNIKEREDETQFILKLMVFWGPSPTPFLNANVLFSRVFFLNLTPYRAKLRVLVLCFPIFMDNSNTNQTILLLLLNNPVALFHLWVLGKSMVCSGI
jgi:hypothetical protein